MDADVDTIKSEIFSLYTATTGRTLAQGDPIRLFLLVITNVVALLLENINLTGKQNLLRYATGDNLDHLGALMGVDRTAATAATTTLTVTISAIRTVSTTIAAGTRVTAGDDVYFATDTLAVIPAGSTSTTVSATCTITGGAGNGYQPGELCKIVDPQPYLDSLINTTVTEGGASIEDDDTYREDIHEAPEKFSVAGPVGAYEYWAKRASSLIQDVAVTSPSAGEVVVYLLLKDGKIPGSEIINAVSKVLGDTSVRPLTDKVSVKAPTVISFDISAIYYIAQADASRADAIANKVSDAVESYVAWQKAALGRDINPSELIHLIMTAGALRVDVTSPVRKVLADSEVGVAGSVSVTLGGLEDE